MIRRLLIPLVGSGLLLAASAESALGKCEGQDPPPFCSQVVASLTVGGGILQAGTPESVSVLVSRGEQPFAAISVVLTLIHDIDGSRLEAETTATATNVPGQWTAEVILPEEGSWMVSALVTDVDGESYQTPVSTEWGMLLPAMAPATPPVTAPPTAPASPVLPIALVLGVLAAAALAVVVIRDRSRRRTAGAAAAHGSAASAATADRA